MTDATDRSPLAAAAAAGVYLVAWIWYLQRRFSAQERGYEALFPHPNA